MNSVEVVLLSLAANGLVLAFIYWIAIPLAIRSATGPCPHYIGDCGPDCPEHGGHADG